MKYLKTILMGLMTLFVTAHASSFTKDEALVQKLREGDIKIVLLRHNESINNIMNIVTSRRSPGYGLSPKGFAEANETAYGLFRHQVNAIYTSPLFRTMQASNIYGTILDLRPEKYTVDDRLAIQFFGDWEGMDYDEYKSHFGRFPAILEGTPQGGESGEAFHERTRDFLWSLIGSSDKNILVVTHGFNYCHIKMLLTGEYGDLPMNGRFEVFNFAK